MTGDEKGPSASPHTYDLLSFDFESFDTNAKLLFLLFALSFSFATLVFLSIIRESCAENPQRGTIKTRVKLTLFTALVGSVAMAFLPIEDEHTQMVLKPSTHAHAYENLSFDIAHYNHASKALFALFCISFIVAAPCACVLLVEVYDKVASLVTGKASAPGESVAPGVCVLMLVPLAVGSTSMAFLPATPNPRYNMTLPPSSSLHDLGDIDFRVDRYTHASKAVFSLFVTAFGLALG